MKIFKDLGWFFKQEWKSYSMGIFLLFLIAILQLVPPRVVGEVADEIGRGELTLSRLGFWLGALAGTGLILYIFRYYWRIFIFGSSIKLARQLRKQLYEHFTKMSTAFYQRKRIGDLMAHATNDVQAVQMTAGSGILTLVDSLFTGGFVILAMAITIDWRLTLISLLPMPLIALATNIYGKKLHHRFRQAQEAFSDLNDKTLESISAIKVIKTFGQEKEDIEDFQRLSLDVVKKNIAVAKIDALYDPTIGGVVGLSLFLSVGVGAKFVLDGTITIGELISFNTYLGLLIWPMLAFGMLFNIVERGSASYERIQNLLAEPVEIDDREDALMRIPKGDIEFHIQSFTYPTDHVPSLKDVHFTLEQGKTLGIVGKTGSGKTTIIKLLLREFEGYQGTISIGGIPIDHYQLKMYRKAFGYVPQDQFLFSTTIRENIAFAKPEATDEEIIKAAEIANVHKDIIHFPEGYDTVVGERGVSLSGGQKQRIAIARAIILNPEILILDDSLSAVDANTEEQILQALKKIRAGKTTIISAHRLSAVQHADLILVVEDGKIVESGDHEELMARDGWYRKMYYQQQLESLVERGG